MAERVTVKRAAELIGLSELSVRRGIEQGRLPIGSSIKRSDKRTIYHISPYLLSQYTGIPVEEINKDRGTSL